MWNCKIHAFCLFVLSILLASCGARVTNSKNEALYTYQNTLLINENVCANETAPPEPSSLEIKKFYQSFQLKYPNSFFVIEERSFDYKFPLVINQEKLIEKLNELKIDVLNPAKIESDFRALSSAVFYLYQDTIRFEGQKCSLEHLATKKRDDLRPYLEMRDFCLQKSNSEICPPETLVSLNKEEAQFVKERSIDMCKSFDMNEVNCYQRFTQPKLQSKKKVNTLFATYQQRFQKERFEVLFKLKGNHSKFACEMIDDVTILKMKVLNRNWDKSRMLDLTNYISRSWSNDRFKIKIELVEIKANDVVEIIPTEGAVSYVPENNHNQVYLSKMLDFEGQKRILTHELGHVLGFPDCYTEFFDKDSKNLIYYEMSKEDKNIMCSVKAGAMVPESYLAQLAQNSCVFN